MPHKAVLQGDKYVSQPSINIQFRSIQFVTTGDLFCPRVLEVSTRDPISNLSKPEVTCTAHLSAQVYLKNWLSLICTSKGTRQIYVLCGQSCSHSSLGYGKTAVEDTVGRVAKSCVHAAAI